MPGSLFESEEQQGKIRLGTPRVTSPYSTVKSKVLVEIESDIRRSLCFIFPRLPGNAVNKQGSPSAFDKSYIDVNIYLSLSRKRRVRSLKNKAAKIDDNLTLAACVLARRITYVVIEI